MKFMKIAAIHENQLQHLKHGPPHFSNLLNRTHVEHFKDIQHFKNGPTSQATAGLGEAPQNLWEMTNMQMN